MYLRDFFEPRAITLPLQAASAADVLPELVGSLGLDPRSTQALLKILVRREELGSTGVGRGIAIPHCRSLALSRLRLAFGRSVPGVDFGAEDQRLVHGIFLIVAPPIEVSNQYLSVLAKIAQFAKEPDTLDRILRLDSVDGFFDLLTSKGI